MSAGKPKIVEVAVGGGGFADALLPRWSAAENSAFLDRLAWAGGGTPAPGGIFAKVDLHNLQVTCLPSPWYRKMTAWSQDPLHLPPSPLHGTWTLSFFFLVMKSRFAL